ncbi:flagellar hook protein FlgE [compost metagenome]
MPKPQFLTLLLVLAGCSTGTVPPTPESASMAARDTALLKPAPNAQGRVIQTDRGTDVAIQGDAMFVLSRTRTPAGIADLVFSRDGAFHLAERPGAVAGTGMYELVNRDGLYVMAYQSVADGNSRPFGTPPEESINDLNTRLVGPGDGQVRPAAVVLDMTANPDTASNVEFDERGMMLIKGDAPRDAAKNALNIHLTLAVFSFAQYLKPLEGDSYAYQPMAGRLYLGTAASSNNGREVGRTNQLVGRSLERR